MKAIIIIFIFNIVLFSCKENSEIKSNFETTSPYDVRSIDYFNTPKELNIGDKAPNFVMNPDSKQPVQLNDFRNKTVLISFGASWCVYCRLFDPKLIELHELYKNSELEIIRVLIDYDEDEFITKLTPDKKIYNIFNQDKYKNLRSIYPIDFFPYYYMIDKYGNIVGKGNPNSNKMFELLEKQVQEN